MLNRTAGGHRKEGYFGLETGKTDQERVDLVSDSKDWGVIFLLPYIYSVEMVLKC